MSCERPTVMVVDDQELFRDGIIQLLQERGISVVGEAGLARDAIRQVCDVDPDVVLMDLNMPGMSGVEATQRLTAAAPHSSPIWRGLSSHPGSSRCWNCSHAECPILRSPGPST